MENQKYNIGDIIQINLLHKALPGGKDLKEGKYVITNFRESLIPQWKRMVYCFKSIRKNSTYEYSFTQQWVEDNSILI